MNEFFEGLKSMLIHFKLDPSNDQAILVFTACCAIIGAIAVFLDFAIYSLKGESLLNLKHSEKNTFILLLLWSVGSLIMGYFGQLLWVFQPSMTAWLVVGFTWPILATKMLEQLKNREIAQEPEQEIYEGEE